LQSDPGGWLLLAYGLLFLEGSDRLQEKQMLLQDRLLLEWKEMHSLWWRRWWFQLLAGKKNRKLCDDELFIKQRPNGMYEKTMLLQAGIPVEWKQMCGMWW
jgi:hypothetical protein